MSGRLALAIASLVLSAQAMAHRGRDMLSVVELDPASRSVMVTHHMTAHDLEPVLRQLAPGAAASVDDAIALQALTDYVGRGFQIALDRREVQLVLSGVQLAGDDVRLIYRGRTPVVDTVDVRSELHDGLQLDLAHVVNVRRAGVTQTLHFHGDADRTQRVVFTRTGEPG